MKQALKYKLRLAIMFNWVVDQEWMDDNDEKTILYEWLNRTLGMFYISVCIFLPLLSPVMFHWKYSESLDFCFNHNYQGAGQVKP